MHPRTQRKAAAAAAVNIAATALLEQEEKEKDEKSLDPAPGGGSVPASNAPNSSAQPSPSDTNGDAAAADDEHMDLTPQEDERQDVRSDVGRTKVSYKVFARFLPQPINFDDSAVSSGILNDNGEIAAFLGVPLSMLKSTLLVHATPKQYMVEIVHPGSRWQDFVCTSSRKLEYSLDGAVCIWGKSDGLPRTVTILEIKIGGVVCKLPKWAWFLSAAGKDYFQRQETHLRLGKILRLLVTLTVLKTYVRFVYSYYSTATEAIEVSCASGEYFYGFLPDARTIKEKLG